MNIFFNDLTITDLVEDIKDLDEKNKFRILPLILIKQNDDHDTFIYPSIFSRLSNLITYGVDYEDFDLYSHIKTYILLRILFPDKKFSYSVLQYIAFVLFHNNITICPYNLKRFFPYLMKIFLITTDNETYEFIYKINRYYLKNYHNLSKKEIEKIEKVVPNIKITQNLEKLVKYYVKKARRIITLKELVDYILDKVSYNQFKIDI